MIKSWTAYSLILILALVLGACNTVKNGATKLVAIVLTLEDGKSERYIETTYEAFAAQKITKANKTLNQYQVTFDCNSKELKTLTKRLSEDKNVKEYLLSDELNPEVQIGQSGKSSKVGPIRKN